MQPTRKATSESDLRHSVTLCIIMEEINGFDKEIQRKGGSQNEVQKRTSS